MNTRQNMIIDNQTNRVITSDIAWCNYNSESHKYDIKFNNGKIYNYSYSRINWLKNPKVLNPGMYQISHSGKELFGITAIYVFEDGPKRYWHICYENGSERDYSESDLKITKSCLSDTESRKVFDYLKKTADLVSLKSDDGTKLLSKQYEKINSFVGNDTALAPYLNPSSYNNSKTDAVPIFPFGCNASQYKAVNAALENKISVIQGPPGTGKTQTILNIIANLLISGKSVQIVSNNNSATANVFEKLNSPKYGMGFLVAALGKSDNKKDFIESQTGFYPDINSWNQEIPDSQTFNENITKRSVELNDIFSKQERLALAKQELQEVKLERQYFEQFSEESAEIKTQYRISKRLHSEQLMKLWIECQHFSDTEKELTFWFKLKNIFQYRIFDFKIYKQDISKIINLIQQLYYNSKIEELEKEISDIEKTLESKNAKQLADEFTSISMSYLKSVLFEKYGNKSVRIQFTEDDLWKNPDAVIAEYPIILSTTFSSRSSLSKDAKFDYLIMDEASQVDVATGALALSCAQNAVIVGDTKQLPNVVSDDIHKRADAIFESYNISESYRFSEKSFLQSVCELLPDVPQTLLREHYRCHPKIINFCNHKFYGGELVIMTEDNDEKDVLSVIKTVAGDHARDRMNQRQIESVKDEILPNIKFEHKEIGIIAPYNNQVNAIKNALSENNIDVATVHKFQGREKDAIILTTVDNEVTDFSDDPYLLNVAVSRAKKQLCVVVSGNEQPSDSNINDLVSYIEYNNFSVTESKIYSVFDYLYSQYTQNRLEYLKRQKKISEYDSENLMYVLIKDSIREMNLLSLDVACHHPLNMLIRDPQFLNDEECRYAMNPATHLDFLIFNKISKKPVLAIEVDGFHFHKEGTKQAERDKIKDAVLCKYNIPFIRFATNGSREKETITAKLNEVYVNKSK